MKKKVLFFSFSWRIWCHYYWCKNNNNILFVTFSAGDALDDAMEQEGSAEQEDLIVNQVKNFEKKNLSEKNLFLSFEFN